MKPKSIWQLFLLLTIGALALSACNMSSGEPTPTEMGVEAVYTAAAQTVEAQFTSAAAAQPSATLTPSPTGTATITPTLEATNTQAAAVIPPAAGGGASSGAVGCNNSAYVSDVTIQDNTQIAPGTTFTKTWRVQNTGTCAWNANYKLIFVSGEAMGGVTTAINQSVNPGASADVSVNLTAPSTPKTYTGNWRLATDSGQAFGTLIYVQIVVAGTPATPGTPGTGVPTITPTFGSSGCYNSALVSANPQDGVNVKAGETFRKTWVIKNTGTCEWNGDFRFVFIGGDILRENTTNRLRRGVIKPGGTVEYFLDFTAPAAPGTYTSNWRLMTDTGTSFGPSFTSRIVVLGATHTPTAQASVTPTSTITMTPVPPTVTPATPSYP